MEVAQSYLWKAFLLQVPDYALTQQVGIFDNVEHLFVILFKEGKL